LIFDAPADSSNAVWQRARAWFGGFTTPQLASASDTLLQSAVTKSSNGAYMITMSRTANGERTRFEVTYHLSGEQPDLAEDRARDRSRELAYIAATGDNQRAFILRNSK
jgi:hypothetical protein